MERATVANRWNVDLIEDYYARWRKDPGSVDESWRNFFEGYELGNQADGPPTASVDLDAARAQAAVTRLIDAYREIGHYLADLDPLEAGPTPPVARTAGPGGLRADRVRPGPRLLQPRRRHGWDGLDPARADRGPARDILPDDRRRVHAHSRHRHPQVAACSGWSRPATGRPSTSARSGGSSTSSTRPSCSRRSSIATTWGRSGSRSKAARC